jgi:hypothetical protein
MGSPQVLNFTVVFSQNEMEWTDDMENEKTVIFDQLK